MTTQHTTPKAQLQLMRQRCATENKWHWARDTQQVEDTHRYSHRNGFKKLTLLRNLGLNLLRCDGFRSTRAGLMEVAQDISRMIG